MIGCAELCLNVVSASGEQTPILGGGGSVLS